jgi:cell division protein FtsL
MIRCAMAISLPTVILLAIFSEVQTMMVLIIALVGAAVLVAYGLIEEKIIQHMIVKSRKKAK